MSPTIILFGGGLLVLAGVTSLPVSVGVVTAERRGVARSLAAVQAIDAAPESLRADLDKPFAERVVAPSASGSSASGGASCAQAPPNESSTGSTSPETRPPGT